MFLDKLILLHQLLESAVVKRTLMGCVAVAELHVQPIHRCLRSVLIRVPLTLQQVQIVLHLAFSGWLD